jgi:hypothetical protein
MERTSTDKHKETGVARNVAAGRYERDEEDDIGSLRAGNYSLPAPECRFLHDLGTWCGRAIHLRGGSISTPATHVFLAHAQAVG